MLICIELLVEVFCVVIHKGARQSSSKSTNDIRPQVERRTYSTRRSPWLLAQCSQDQSSPSMTMSDGASDDKGGEPPVDLESNHQTNGHDVVVLNLSPSNRIVGSTSLRKVPHPPTTATNKSSGDTGEACEGCQSPLTRKQAIETTSS